MYGKEYLEKSYYKKNSRITSYNVCYTKLLRGSLTVNANYADGITSADDLKFLSGSYTINSEDDAIKGKDSVVIKEGTYVIEADGDAIKATEAEDTTKGYILIESGTFTIDSGLDGLQAETKILINGGIV